ncbi:hypothetical protein ADK67_44060 [Saccharothrix sp. NRRL B-16348]|nr:hypothetical protein ADK67_44060 [Saccharothrix sp. NRRL B-16348]
MIGSSDLAMFSVSAGIVSLDVPSNDASMLSGVYGRSLIADELVAVLPAFGCAGPGMSMSTW